MEEFATPVKNVMLKNPIDFNDLQSQKTGSPKLFSKEIFLGSSLFWSLLKGSKDSVSSIEEYDKRNNDIDIEDYMYKTMF
jgi:hypothetical protein